MAAPCATLQPGCQGCTQQHKVKRPSPNLSDFPRMKGNAVLPPVRGRAMAIYPVYTHSAWKWDCSWPRAPSHAGSSPKAAGVSPPAAPKPGNPLAEAMGAAESNGVTGGPCGKGGSRELQRMSRLPLGGPGQGEHPAPKADGLSPRNESEN